MSKDGYLQKALDYIDRNLLSDISLYDISKEAGFSVPHFYRLFRRLTGDTVGAYVNRHRLAMAARELRESRKPILEIALYYGFQSHDVFTRAFTREYGLSPNKYRTIASPPPLKKIKTLESVSQPDGQQMAFGVISSKGFYVVGMECTAEKWDADGSIGRLWSDFLERTDEIVNISLPMTMYGISEYETCGSDRFRYMAGIGVGSADGIPEGMAVRYIRKQRFFQACVPDAIGIPDAFTGAIGVARSLGYNLDDYDDIEVYEDIFQDPEFNSFKLLIPIKCEEGENLK